MPDTLETPSQTDGTPGATPAYLEEIRTKHEKRRPGRPRKIAPWYAAVAKRMADGTTLKRALMWERIQLDRNEIRLLYKNLEFRKMYRLERHLYMINEFGRREKTEQERIRKKLERMIR